MLDKEENMENKDFNYLNLKMDSKDVIQTFPQNFNMSREAYKDPDTWNRELYKDIAQKFFNNKILPNGNKIKIREIKFLDYPTKFGYQIEQYELRVEIYNPLNELVMTVGLGSDYIGPSRGWGEGAGLTDTEIIDFLKISRKFGGHIVFPRWITFPNNKKPIFGSTINMCRGGKGGLYDRFDLTLLDLKNWYCEKSSYLVRSYNKYRLWLEQFVTFEKFIVFFQLQDFLSEDLGSIKNLISFENGKYDYFSENEVVSKSNKIIPKEHNDYLKYVNGSNTVLEQRNLNL
jgi:hypothetical protein